MQDRDEFTDDIGQRAADVERDDKDGGMAKKMELEIEMELEERKETGQQDRGQRTSMAGTQQRRRRATWS
jgi:hypothetical protein